MWLADSDIGSLHRGWNYLEGWYPAVLNGVKAIHYTRGGPWFDHMKDCDFAAQWLAEESEYRKTLLHLA